MSYTLNGTDQYLSLENANIPPSDTTGVTLFCWIRDSSYAAVKGLVAIGNLGGAADQIALRVDGNKQAIASVYQTSTPTSAACTTAANVNDVWCAMAARYTFSSGVCTKVTAWQYNGTDQADPVEVTGLTATLSPWINDLLVGARHITSPGDLPSLDIAHVAVWNKELLDSELEQLISATPDQVAFSSLIGYWPLVDNLNSGLVGGSALVENGTTPIPYSAAAENNPSLPGLPLQISSVSDTTWNDGQTGITITGTEFKATQSTGKVYLCPTDDVDDVNRIEQTVNGWGDTSINITAVRDTLSHSTNLYLFVVNSDSASNTNGYVIQFNPYKRLKVLVHSSAAGATGIRGVVWAEPSVGTVAGAEIGEFTGQAFEADLESGQAVLKVNVSEFGGESLTTSDTPVVLVRNDTNTTGIINATIIEE